MKILIIGASGMLAKPVIRQFDEMGFQLRLFSRTVNPSMFSKAYEMVQGDVFNPEDMDKAMDGCDGVHISISKTDEAAATKAIVEAAQRNRIGLISMVSGCTVSEENRWFEMIDKKYIAEQYLINSGIPYMIFRPTWFFESLDLMVRNGKASIPGKQPHPYHWIAADDFARMVVTAYSKPEAKNSVFLTYGPRSYTMNEALTAYCKVLHPSIKKVSSTPLGILKLMATLSGNKVLKFVAAMFAYFEKVKEPANDGKADSLLGKPGTDLDKWLKMKIQAEDR